MGLKQLLTFASYVVLIEFFQTFFKVLVKKKNFLAFDANFVQNCINLDREKILTNVAFFKKSVLPNFPNLVKSSKMLEIIKY